MRGGAYTAKQRKEALEAAEKILVRPKKAGATVRLNVNEVDLKPELFQPREFTYGFFETDKGHVGKLKKAIEVNGELDPIVVTKLGETWVCVDGHHRLEAYKKAKWKKRIECEWFGGNAREAMDESMARNKKDRLNVPHADRLEEAWKRVLMRGWSKAQIVKLCGVGEGTVANMRKVVRAAEADDEFGKAFRERLDKPLSETSWYIARMTYDGVEPEKANEEVEAYRLAKRLHSRMTNLLSRDAKITARALELYDPELPWKLVAAWDPFKLPSPGSADPDLYEL
jgi:hypothetical protein